MPGPDVGLLLGALSGWAYAAATFAGLAVVALLPARRSPRSPAPTGPGSTAPAWVRGRPDAPPLSRRLLPSCALGVVVGLLLDREGPPAGVAWSLALLVAAGLVVALGRLEPGAARRRRQLLVLQTPQALELMASCLSAGLPVRGACAAVVAAFDGPVAEDLGGVRALTDLGVSDADAWSTLAGHPQLGPVAADLARSVESGTLLVSTLRHHAAHARDRRRAALQVVARSVGVRSVLPLMTCFIPAFLLLGVVPTIASAMARALSL